MADERIHGARVVCAWCKADLGAAPGCDADSHGICEACRARLSEERSEPQPVRGALVALLRRKIRLGHVGSEAALRAVTRTPRFKRDVLGE